MVVGGYACYHSPNGVSTSLVGANLLIGVCGAVVVIVVIVVVVRKRKKAKALAALEAEDSDEDL